jgi:hypothetical protein
MLIKILLVLFGVLVILLPLITVITENKKVTKWGKLFYVIISLFALLQIINEINNSNDIVHSANATNDLKRKVDSLNIIGMKSSDTINKLKGILHSIDRQVGYTNVKLAKIDGNDNEKIKSDRPVIQLISGQIIKNNSSKNDHSINFVFNNTGKRSATSIVGDVYVMCRDTLYYMGSFPMSKSDIISYNSSITFHTTLNFSIDSISFIDPIYFYFKGTYSDLILRTPYNFESSMKIAPFIKGDISPELAYCPNWIVSKIRKDIDMNQYYKRELLILPGINLSKDSVLRK